MKTIQYKFNDGSIKQVNVTDELYALHAVEYAVGGSYKFSGYVSGYGADENAESNLTCSVTELETISLDVRSTNFRTQSSSAGKDHQNQLDSVYFSVDNSLLEKYGKLQKIKAEWYEYKTAPIVVVSDKGIYDTLNGYVGKNIGEHTDGLRYSLGYDRNVISSQYSTIINYGWSYNVDCYSSVGLSTFVVDSADICPLLPYLFYTGGTRVGSLSAGRIEVPSPAKINHIPWPQFIRFNMMM